MEHGRSYGLCKKIVADVLVLSGGLTDNDYKELAEEINKNEEG